MSINFYAYLSIIFCWLVYLVNSFYQNYKMKRRLSKITELFMTPFYIFTVFAFFILGEKMLLYFLKNSPNDLTTTDGFYAFKITLILIGIIFLFASVVLYIYVNFFEKSFPSCLTLKSKKELQGIYNYVRHPSFYIFFLITFGTALSLQNFTLFLLAIANHISLYFFYSIEEKKFRKDSLYYANYLKKTKRFFPRFSKM